jgi:FkbM family methyltransferase
MSEPVRDGPLVMAECRYGRMLTFEHDTVIGRSLRLYGEWAQHEITILGEYLRPGAVAVDVGANVGTHSLAFSVLEPRGRVVAVEAQPTVAAVLEVNRQFGARENLSTVNALLADRSGWARISPGLAKAANVGAVALGDATRGRLAPLWRRLLPCRGTYQVPVRTLDAIVAGEEVSLIKLDIEGMEASALAGAQRTLRRCRPILYIEQLDITQLSRILAILKTFDYKSFWLETHPFNQLNMNNIQENIWHRTETGILALPCSIRIQFDLVPATLGDSAPPKLLDARQGWTGELTIS